MDSSGTVPSMCRRSGLLLSCERILGGFRSSAANNPFRFLFYKKDGYALL